MRYIKATMKMLYGDLILVAFMFAIILMLY